MTDLIAENGGIVHGIDRVLLPECIASTLYDRMGSANGDFQMLREVIDVTGLRAALESTNGDAITLLAPVESAWGKLDPATRGALDADPSVASPILAYHALPGNIFFDDETPRPRYLRSIAGLSVLTDKQVVNGANATTFRSGNIDDPAVLLSERPPGSVLCSNGVIHPIGSVMLPPDTVQILRNDPSFTTMHDSVLDYGLLGLLERTGGDRTVFVPSNAVFESYVPPFPWTFEYGGHVREVLLSHMTLSQLGSNEIYGFLDGIPTMAMGDAGRVVSVNGTSETLGDLGARIVYADITSLDGILHEVDNILIPRGNAWNSTLLDLLSSSDDGNEVDVDDDDDEYTNVLLDLVRLAGLEDLLSSSSPTGLTVFVPDDIGWVSNFPQLLETLKNPSNAEFLSSTVSNHLVRSNIYDFDVGESLPVASALHVVWTTAEDDLASVNFIDLVDPTSVSRTDPGRRSGMAIMARNGLAYRVTGPILPASVAEIILSTTSRYNTTSFAELLRQLNFINQLFYDVEDPQNVPLVNVFIPTDDAMDDIADLLERLTNGYWTFHLRNLARHHLNTGYLIANDLQSSTTLPMVSRFVVGVNVDNETGVVTIGNATMTNPDLFGWNGVVHVIDTVLLPPWVDVTLMDMIRTQPDMTILLSLIERVGFTNVLDDTTENVIITFFAPTDDALQSFLTEIGTYPTDGEIVDILSYHAIPIVGFTGGFPLDGTVAREPTLLRGLPLVLYGTNRTSHRVNNATIVTSRRNQYAFNGVLQVIDSVLVPGEIAPFPNETSTPRPTVMEPPSKMPSTMPSAVPMPSDVFNATATTTFPPTATTPTTTTTTTTPSPTTTTTAAPAPTSAAATATATMGGGYYPILGVSVLGSVLVLFC